MTMKLPMQFATKRVSRKPRPVLLVPTVKKQLSEPNAKMHFINANDFLYATAVKFCSVSLDDYLESHVRARSDSKK